MFNSLNKHKQIMVICDWNSAEEAFSWNGFYKLSKAIELTKAKSLRLRLRIWGSFKAAEKEVLIKNLKLLNIDDTQYCFYDAANFKALRTDLILMLKTLMQKQLVYPCYCSKVELEKIHQAQILRKIKTGYYGKWAQCKRSTLEAGDELGLRIRINSEAINMQLDEHESKLAEDLVIFAKNEKFEPLVFQILLNLKEESILVVGIENELLGINLQKILINQLSANHLDFKYFKLNTNKINLSYSWQELIQAGYPQTVLIDWLFDEKSTNILQLQEIAKNFLANLETEALLEQADMWAQLNNPALGIKMKQFKQQIIKYIEIGKLGEKIRKDYLKFSDLENIIKIISADDFDSTIVNWNKLIEFTSAEAILLLQQLERVCLKEQQKSDWFSGIKKLTAKHFNTKQVNKEQVNKITMLLRLALTKKTITADLLEIIKILGEQEIERRIAVVSSEINNNQGFIKFKKGELTTLANKLNGLICDYRMVSKDYIKTELYDEGPILSAKIQEGFFVSTCLRSEVYAIANNKADHLTQNPKYFFGNGKILLKRLVSIMCGLQSEIQGEREIQNQFLEAIHRSYDVGKLTSDNFETLIKLVELSDEIRKEFDLTTTENYSTIGARLITKQVHLGKSPTFMVIGGGYMAESFLASIAGTVSKLIWVNRDIEKIRKRLQNIPELTEKKTVLVPFADVKKFLPLADIVFIAINNCPNYFTSEDVNKLPKKAFIVDVSYPGTIPANAGRKVINIANTNFGALAEKKISRAQYVAASDRINQLIDKY